MIRLRERVAFEDEKMARHRLIGTPRCQADLYCLRPGQRQAPHAHADQDKLYLGVEGVGRIPRRERRLRHRTEPHRRTSS